MRKLFAGCLAIVAIIPIAAIAALALFAADLLERIAWYALYGCAGLALLAVCIVANVAHSQRERRERTYIDGALPVMRRRRHIWRSDIPTPLAVWSLLVGEEFYIDPNRMMSPAWSFDAFGRVGQVEPVGGWAAQHSYNLAVEHTNTVRAIAQGDDSRNHLFGRDSMPVRLPARALAPRVERPQLPMPIEDPEPEPALTPQTALARSENGIVYIGQERDGRRQLATWDSNGASTLGIFGANGTGKTSTVATMVTLAMVRWGWRLWILDGKDAGDWDEFATHAAVAPVAQHNIEDVMQGVWEEYQRRERMMSEYRARQYRQLPADVQAEFPQWGVVFEEFGATRLGLRSKTRAQLDQFINILCQKARYTGWHGVFIDQRPSEYTDEMKGNLKSIACFKLLMNQGHAVNAYHAGQLADVGEFEMNAGRYWAFHAEPLARPMLARLPAVHTVRSLNEPNHTTVYQPEPAPRLVHESSEPVNHTPETWENAAFDYLRKHPMARPIDLAEWMADIKGKTKKDMKSTAHLYYCKYQEMKH